ncbi:MAG: hypothetical protein KUG82_13270 [Pseudomonadales bacterium]|nr:hypothetical protein [Pseudomonadales bacterium]
MYGVEIDEIQISGFLSQGYLESTENDYFEGTKKGSWNFSEVGLNFIVPLDDNLYFGMQFFSHRLATEVESTPTIDWAFFDYSRESWLGFRVGKLKLPFGLYNKQREVDSLRTSVLLPQTVYTEGLRDFMVAIQGFELYGNLDLEKAGYVDYEVFIGSRVVDSSSGYLENSMGLMRLEFLDQGLNLDVFLDLAGVTLSDAVINIRHLEGFGFQWSPMPDLRLGYTRFQATIGFDLKGFTGSKIKMPEMSVGSVEYDKNKLTLVYEYFILRSGVAAEFTSLTSFETEGWYAGASWQFNNSLSASFSYGENFPLGGENRAEYFTSKGLPDYLAWQKEATYSVAYQLTEVSMIKVEVKNINGAGLSNPFVIDFVPVQNWRLYSIKASIAF